MGATRGDPRLRWLRPVDFMDYGVINDGCHLHLAYKLYNDGSDDVVVNGRLI